MEKTVMVQTISEENEIKLKEMYLKVVSEPNQDCFKKGFIKCPECSEEILMIPSLRAMNDAIENHVKIHKESLETNSIVMHSKSINIRLDLAQQVLLQASNRFQ
jgi:hypothetical protein